MLFATIATLTAHAQTWNTEEQYIQRFAAYAVEEMELYKIPASITLAQGLLETAGGQSRLAQEAKNHFGIKCKENWTGRTITHTDDAPNECFRAYDTPRDSYRDHSLFLATRKFYASLFTLDPKDYKAWAYGLKTAGYATNARYAPALISKIEKYRLYEFDHVSTAMVGEKLLAMYPDLKNDAVFLAQYGGTKQTSAPEPTIKVAYQPTSYAQQQQTVARKVAEAKSKAPLEDMLVKNHPNGGLRFVIVPEPMDLSQIAKKFNISQNRLMKYNELSGTRLNKNQLVFLDNKKKSAKQKTYNAQAGESMYDIAQKFAMRLDHLYTKNRMAYGDQPVAGQVIYLDAKKPRS
ncbi:MAG: LysM peptidoglycan-binding domain-containing protein [Chryseobacterium sp.]|nr:MAG: LysM peptidoglycan-binding domain-containing protein [Chryseobacterium sp.]